MKKLKKINPNRIKSRDLVHLQEITHPSGTGPHRSKKRPTRQQRQDETRIEVNKDV